jgi:hypothetical protein
MEKIYDLLRYKFLDFMVNSIVDEIALKKQEIVMTHAMTL